MSDTRILPHATLTVNLPLHETSGTETDSLEAAQFMDLYAWLCHAGEFAGFSAVPWEELGLCEVLDEPTDEPEGLRIYLRDGWPVAVLEFDTGYRVVPGMMTNRWL